MRARLEVLRAPANAVHSPRQGKPLADHPSQPSHAFRRRRIFATPRRLNPCQPFSTSKRLSPILVLFEFAQTLLESMDQRLIAFGRDQGQQFEQHVPLQR